MERQLDMATSHKTIQHIAYGRGFHIFRDKLHEDST